MFNLKNKNMKKIYSLLALSTLVTGAFAQTTLLKPAAVSGSAELLKTLDVVKSENVLKGATTDTTGWNNTPNFLPEFLPNGTGLSLYGYTGGGYFYGSNNDSLNCVAQGYENTNNSTAEIKEILLWVGAKDEVSGNGSMTVNVYKMAPNMAFDNLQGQTPDAEGPEATPVASETLLLSACDTTSGLNFTSVVLSSPVSVSGNFAIELDASSFTASGDTIGLVSDADGDGQGYAFIRRSPMYYYMLVRSAASLDNNIAMFAVIGDNNVGINDNEFFNGVQLSAYPNPAVENTTISFRLENNFNNVKVVIMDAQGRVVNRIEKGALASGLYNEVLSVSDLSAGKYYYTIYADGTKLTKSFNVVK